MRLTRGDYATKKVYDASPVETARRYADCGVQRIHLVDLDAADLGAFRLTVEQLGAPNENTRRILQQILAAASDESGCTYRLRQYSNVDVLPDKVGGCLLILSDYEKRRTRKNQCFFCASFNITLISKA